MCLSPLPRPTHTTHSLARVRAGLSGGLGLGRDASGRGKLSGHQWMVARRGAPPLTPLPPSPTHSRYSTPLTQTALDLLQKQFPESARVGRLVGMEAEAEGDFEGAATWYLRLRERFPTDPVSL